MKKDPFGPFSNYKGDYYAFKTKKYKKFILKYCSQLIISNFKNKVNYFLNNGNFYFVFRVKLKGINYFLLFLSQSDFCYRQFMIGAYGHSYFIN